MIARSAKPERWQRLGARHAPQLCASPPPPNPPIVLSRRHCACEPEPCCLPICQTCLHLSFFLFNTLSVTQLCTALPLLFHKTLEATALANLTAALTLPGPTAQLITPLSS